MDSQRKIIEAIIGYLEVERDAGTEWIPIRKTSQSYASNQDASNTVMTYPEKMISEEKSKKGAGSVLPEIIPSLSTTDENEIKIRKEALSRIEDAVKRCRRCILFEQRTKTVFHDGHPCARVCFVGEGPGAEEDATGIPFVGKAGKLLTKIINAMGLSRENVYIINTVKCRPPGNRTPTRQEMETCKPYLEKQIEIVKPHVIVALGLPAAQSLIGNIPSISKNRGKWMEYRGIPVMLTYHPAYLLRNPDAKRFVWEDMKIVHDFLMNKKDGAKISEQNIPQPGSNLSLLKT